ncbi:MAG TPA: rhodanese-related sulfurtransferase [Candidatus Sulfotelmatobacter sp.]|nr:rhodanese-related sulfurtransferase [Candidatus Sulfotelmatobacter sp.]
MEKIILFYKFTPLTDPKAICLWQKSLASQYSLKGRVIVATQGINGTLAGDIEDLKKYIKDTKSYPQFKRISFKWSEGTKNDFPSLSVKVRSEIVTFGVADKIQVSNRGIEGGGKHISPKDLDKLVKSRGDDIIFFDGRNDFESSIGKFKNAVTPEVKHTRDFPKELKSKKYDAIKDKPVVTYCTGGVRCEVLTKLMKDEGFKEVYQIDGGIVKYGETFKDKGLWEGKLFVFDGRLATGFSNEAKDIGSCDICQGKTSNYVNCADKSCNRLVLICKDCYKTTTVHCPDCTAMLANKV